MRRGFRALAILLLVAGAGWFVWIYAVKTPAAPAGPGGGQAAAGRRGGGRGGEGGPTSVVTVAARYADVPVTLEAVGTAQALNNVTVRSQVDGRLVEIAFREGQDVRRGDVIARIDPTIYKAQYDQAVAKKAQDEANLANMRVDLERYVNLAKTNYGSKQQSDTQRSSVAQMEAQVQSDQGAIDNARAYLDYTTIRSPLDGRLGIRLVDQGNIVHAADATGIVVATQLKPISVLFNLPQQNLRAVNAASAKGPLAAVALDSDNRTALDEGRLEVVDNLVDQTTGTVKLKATFPNDHLQLWPGSFVNVRLTVDTLKNAITVPTAAVQRGPNGTFVYGVADGKAKLVPVTLGRQTEAVSVIETGLAPPQAVITTGFARLTDGDAVRVTEPDRAGPGTDATGSGDAPAAERRRRPRADRPAPDASGEAATQGGGADPAAMGLRTGGDAAAASGSAATAPDGGDRAERRRRRQDGQGGGRPNAPGTATP